MPTLSEVSWILFRIAMGLIAAVAVVGLGAYLVIGVIIMIRTMIQAL